MSAIRAKKNPTSNSPLFIYSRTEVGCAREWDRCKKMWKEHFLFLRFCFLHCFLIKCLGKIKNCWYRKCSKSKQNKKYLKSGISFHIFSSLLCQSVLGSLSMCMISKMFIYCFIRLFLRNGMLKSVLHILSDIFFSSL